MLASSHARYRLALLVPLAAGLSVAGCFDDSGYELDQESGATSSRGGTKSTTAGKSGSSNAAGNATVNMGGSGDIDVPEPVVESMQPESGPYGTLVTITGQSLGSEGVSGFTLTLADGLVLTPQDETSVVSWTDTEIVLRYPFPAEGVISLESPGGTATVGRFTPTWHIAREIETAPVATALASISPEPNRIMMLFDTMPLSLLEVGPEGVIEHAVSAENVDASSVRLYLNATGQVEAVGVSDEAEPVLVHFANEEGDLVGTATSIALQATEYVVAGGSEGAAVWMKRTAGWHRASPSTTGWKLDKGPIADPDPSAPDRAAGASSDGSLYLAHSEDAGFLTDDMEAPYTVRLTPTGTQFGPATRAGAAVDDYVTTLRLTSSGDGLVVRVCGSDADPFGFSGTDYYCYDGLHAPNGAQLFGVQVDAKASAHAFTQERAVAAYCSSDRRWFIRTDLDVEETPDTPLGEQVLFPCPEAVALEVNGDGDYLPVVRVANKTYLLERNPEL
jgi:hypothetical protein